MWTTLRAAALIGIVNLAQNAQAEQTFLRLDLGSPLTQTQREILLQALSPGTDNAALRATLGRPRTIDEICTSDRCRSALQGAARQVQRPQWAYPGASPDAELAILEAQRKNAGTLVLPRVTNPAQPQIDYVPVPQMDSLMSELLRLQMLNSEYEPSGSAPLFVPVQPDENGPAVPALTLSTAAEAALTAIDRDFERFGRSNRTFVLPGNLESRTTKKLIAALAREQQVQAFLGKRQSFDTGASSMPMTIGFTSSATGDTCSATHPDWPFDVDALADLLRFNMHALSLAGVRRPQRAKVMIVDTGLPRAVAELAAFAPFLDVDPMTFLYPALAYEENRQETLHCLRHDLTEKVSAYGYGASAEIGGWCKVSSPIEHILPVEAPPGTRVPYAPGHGGYVGVLAAGGPDLIEAGLALDRHIGLSFARIMHIDDQNGTPVLAGFPSSVQQAVNVAMSRGTHILNMSLRIEDPNGSGSMIDTIQKFPGLKIVAAGNDGLKLTSSLSSFPANMSSTAFDNVLVVGALQRNAVTGAVEIWDRSAKSGGSKHVDIAAPGAQIWSLDRSGALTCDSGTSAAAPIVSFVAAMLLSYGFQNPEDIERRILATARYEPALNGAVTRNRTLDIQSALDVTVDQVWLEDDPDTSVTEDPSQPIRGRILPQLITDNVSIPYLPLCDRADDEGEHGLLDVRRLLYWERTGDTAVRWRREAGSLSIYEGSCSIKPGHRYAIRFCNLETGKITELPPERVRRIVPTRLRNAIVPTIQAFAESDRAPSAGIHPDCLIE